LRSTSGRTLGEMPVTTQELPPYQLIDVQVALDAWPSLGPDRDVAVVGISGDQRRFHPLSELLRGGQSFGVGSHRPALVSVVG
jgi:hypothetical protein